MVDQEHKDELVEEVKKLRKKLSKIERESKAGLEDQLFFGFVISIAFFVITLDLNEFAFFFQSIIGLSPVDALTLSETIRNISIASLVLSSISRYYGAIKPHKGARLVSFLSLITALDFFLLMFVINISKGVAIEVSVFTLPFSLVALFIIYFVIGFFVEKKIVKFYAERRLVLKKYARFPIISPLFADITFALYSMLVTQFILGVFLGVSLDQNQLYITYLLFSCPFLVFYFLRLKREKMIMFGKRK